MGNQPCFCDDFRCYISGRPADGVKGSFHHRGQAKVPQLQALTAVCMLIHLNADTHTHTHTGEHESSLLRKEYLCCLAQGCWPDDGAWINMTQTAMYVSPFDVTEIACVRVCVTVCVCVGMSKTKAKQVAHFCSSPSLVDPTHGGAALRVSYVCLHLQIWIFLNNICYPCRHKYNS